MNIWKKDFTLKSINDMNNNTAAENMGIIITSVGENTIKGEMPVDKRTCQPRGILHGGASALFAETLGSLGAYLSVNNEYTIAGIEINANHIAGVSKGEVVGVATAAHIGKTTQVWDIKINHKQTNKVICISRLTLAVIKLNK